MGPRRVEITRLAEALEQYRRERFWSMAGPEPLYRSQRIDRELPMPVPGVTYSWEGPFRVSYTPIRPGSLAILEQVFIGHDEYSVIATDNRMGVIAGVGILGSIDYATGDICFTMMPEQTRVSVNGPIYATYEYDLPRVEITLTSEPDPAVARTLRAWHDRVFRDVGLPAAIVQPGPEDRTNYAQARIELEGFARRMRDGL